MLELEGEDQDAEDQGGEGGGTAPEYDVTDLVRGVVAVQAELSVVASVHNHDELGEWASATGSRLRGKNRAHANKREGAHNSAVCKAVNDNWPSEDAVLDIMRGPEHGIGSSLLQTQTKCRGSAGQHVDPKHGDGAEWEHAAFLDVLEGEAKDQDDDFGDIDCEEVDDEALDVGK